MFASLLIKSGLIYSLFLFTRSLLRRFALKSPLDDLPSPPPYSWLLGNIPQLFNYNGWEFHRNILETYGRAMMIRGVLGERLLLTVDPKALYHIVVKDQDCYEETAWTSRNEVLFGKGLLSTVGEQHRKQKKMLKPVFSTKNMREMVPIFYEVTERLRTLLKNTLKDGPQEVDMLHWVSRTSLELIGQSGMGYSFDALDGDESDHPYTRTVKRFTTLLGGPMGFFAMHFIFPFTAKIKYPRLKRFVVDHIPSRRIRELTKIVDTIHNTSLDIIKAKQEAFTNADPEVRAEMANKKDIITILMRENAMASEEDRISDEEVVGQITTLIFAAMDTTTSAVCRILDLLANNQDVQEKVRNEIQEVQKDSQLSYDQLLSLPFLDAVCRETLRLYPPVNVPPMRTARKDMIIPLSKPILGSTGKEITEIFIPKGTDIQISILGANCNPDLWGPDAYEWKPERWLSPLPEALEQAHIPGVYSHLMTFLGGGHACVGFKFAQLEMKIIVSVLLTSFKLSVSDKTVFWQMTGIAGPTVEGPDGRYRKLPFTMTRID